MKETSAHRRLWKMECNGFIAENKNFKVTNISVPDDEAFCQILVKRHNLIMERQGSTVTFTLPPVAPS